MRTKVIIDCDPGIDDAVALAMALFDPRLEVLAITATAGSISAQQATDNVQAIINQLDPPRFPRIGRAISISHAPVYDDGYLHGPQGLGEFKAQTSQRQHTPTSDKVIAELLRMYPGQVSLICLGPLTNLARMLQRDASVVDFIDKVFVSGGTVRCNGNVTAAAERNIFFDPPAAHAVFRSPITKSIIPLDITDGVTFGVDLLEKLPGRETRAGKLLHQLLLYAFRTHHQKLGREMIPLQDPVTMIAALEPTLFQWQQMPADVEVEGVITRGMTVFDRRHVSEPQTDIEVAIGVEKDEVRRQIVRGLQYAGQQT